jgi:Bacterial SH3 domain
MPASFEIIDPLERFVEAREEGLSEDAETASQARRASPRKLFWLAGVALFAISTLILGNTISPRVAGESTSSGVPNHSDTAAQQQRTSLPTAPSQAQSVHAIDPYAFATQNTESQVQADQKPMPISTETTDRRSAAVESSSSAKLRDESSAAVGVTEAPSQPELGDQVLKLTSPATIYNAPSASADIIGTAFAGARVRVETQNSGWVNIVDPDSGNEGWIHSTALSPLTQMSENEPAGAWNERPLEQGLEIPDENDLWAMTQSQPQAKAKRHSSKSHYGRKRFAVRLNLRRFFRR